MHILAAPDKFRGTVTAPQAAAAIAAAARWHGDTCRQAPLADGGEGTLDAFGGGNRLTPVSDPLGRTVLAGWRFDGGLAVIESALASGMALVGTVNDPVAASTAGSGQLVAAALAAGATRIMIGMGGSATTDGGLGAVRVLAPGEGPATPFAGVDVQVISDVRTRFVDAAAVFGPQKGADPAAVRALTDRLSRLAGYYRQRFGVDVSQLAGSGAAGGLAGGLAALGARLVDGFAAVAAEVGLDDELARADLVVTGEGGVDAASFDGKVVGSVIERARRHGIPVLVVAGIVDPGIAVPAGVTVCGLVETFGADRSRQDTAACIQDAVTRYLSALPDAPEGPAPEVTGSS